MVPSASASLGETGRGNSARLAWRPGRDRADAALNRLVLWSPLMPKLGQQRRSQLRSNFRCAAVRSLVVNMSRAQVRADPWAAPRRHRTSSGIRHLAELIQDVVSGGIHLTFVPTRNETCNARARARSISANNRTKRQTGGSQHKVLVM